MKGTCFLLLSCMYTMVSCNQEVTPPPEAFRKTWYAGKAEVSSYSLSQARYGTLRLGEAVLIFVTEDFSAAKLVKLDEPHTTAKKLRVLKMNLTKNFVTGIYPYSMMLSVFTPVSRDGDAKTLKAVCSSQEWCGQTFAQLQWKEGDYQWQLHSYYEKDGEQHKEVEGSLLEDELWNRIRINPASLPQGRVGLVPGLLWQRLSHTMPKKEEAVLSLAKADTAFVKDTGTRLYTIHYPVLQRTLTIYFQERFPHTILGWQERYRDGWGRDKKMLTTQALRKRTLWLDYWNYHSLADTRYRDSLQLMRYE